MQYNSALEDLILEAYNGNPPDEVILAIGGCRYCAMTGYEDYPTSKKPCRLGHISIEEEFEKRAKSWGSASYFDGFGIALSDDK